MSQLTPYQAPDRTVEFLPPREEFARVTDLATRLAGTEFVPTALRGNPPAVLAAMLTGRELGLAPMESLRSIHMIEGKPTLSAEATMKLAQEAGHLLIVTDTTRERATVRYRNGSWPDDEPARELTFDLEDAKLAGLTDGKRGSMYRKYPRAMLRSRAITEAARAGGLLAGAALAYTTEELTDDADLEDGTVEEAVVVESISPDSADVDELETRRTLHKRAAAAYRRAAELDEEAAGTAWAAASAGLGGNAWTEADLDVLEIRVGDLERIADQLEAEHDDDNDADGDGGAPPADDDDGPDDATDATGDDPAPDSSTDSDEEEAAVEDAPDLDGVELAQLDAEERLRAVYGDLTVAQVGELLRRRETEHSLHDGGTLRVVLPRAEQPGGVLAGLELVEELEAEHHDPPRKTVGGALESAGWTPRGRQSLTNARIRATMDEPDEAATTGPDTAPDAQTATESDGEASTSELLDRFGDLIERDDLDVGVVGGFRKRLGELIVDGDDGVPDRDALAALVRHLERA